MIITSNWHQMYDRGLVDTPDTDSSWPDSLRRRVLSELFVDMPRRLYSVHVRTGLPTEQVNAIMLGFLRGGLIEQAPNRWGEVAYRLTGAGKDELELLR